MKKLTILLAALAAMVSCNKENPVSPETPSQEKYSFSITASAPESDDMTKTTLVEGGNYVHWSKGDAIKVLFFAHHGPYLSDSYYNFTGTFTSEGQVLTSYFEDESIDKANFRIDNWSTSGGRNIIKHRKSFKDLGIAVYPSTATAVSAKTSESPADLEKINTEISFDLPVEQVAVEDNIQSGLNFSYARVDLDSFLGTLNGESVTSLQFKNACALVKITMPQSFGDKKVTSVTVSSKDSAPLAGYGRVKTSQSNRYIDQDVIGTFTVEAEGESGVTLTCAEGFETGASYYAVVWPGEHSGLSLTFAADDETFATVEAKAVNLQASHVKPYKISELTFEGKSVDKYPEDCEEGEVYNYYYSDGTVGTNPAPVGKSVLGVVFYQGNPREKDTALPEHCTHGLAIGLKDFSAQWNKSTVNYGEDDGYTYWGYGSMTRIKSSDGNIGLYSVTFDEIDPTRTSGWYVPSGLEWRELFDYASVNALLEACSGTTIGDNTQYWIPSLYSWMNARYIYFSGGSLKEGNVRLNNSKNVRPIFAF